MVLSFRFEQRFGPFTILLVEGLFETGHFRHFLTTFLAVRKFKNELSGSLSEDPARSNMVKTPKHCSNLKDSTLLTQFSWKKSPWVRYKILGVFVNTLTADCKYSLLNRDNLLQHLQLQLSEKQKNYFPLFLYILEI